MHWRWRIGVAALCVATAVIVPFFFGALAAAATPEGWSSGRVGLLCGSICGAVVFVAAAIVLGVIAGEEYGQQPRRRP